MTLPTKTSWPRVALAYLAGVAGAWQLGKFPPFLDQLAADLALSGAQAGALSTITTLFAIGLSAPAALLVNRWGPDRCVTIAVGVIGAGVLVVALAASPMVLLAGRVLEALGYVLVIVAGPTAIALACGSTQDRMRALALWGTFVPVGLALGTGLGGLLAERGGIPLALYAALVLPTLIGFLSLPRAIRDTTIDPAPGDGTPNKGGAGVLGWLVAAAFGWFAFAYILPPIYLPSHWQDLGGWSIAEAGSAAAAVNVLAVLGSLAAAWAVGKGFNPAHTGIIGVVVSGVLGGLAFIVPGIGASLILAGLASMVGGLTPASLFATVPRISPNAATLAAVNAAIATLGSLGSFVSGFVGGVAREGAGGPGIAATIAAASLFSLVCFVVLLRKMHGKNREPAM